MDHRRSFRVRHYECDAYGHLNNTAYLRYLEEVEIDAGLVTSAAGGGMSVAHVDITYVRPVGFGDTVEVTAGDGAARTGWLERRYDYRNDGGVEAARAAVLWSEPGAVPALPIVPPAPPPPGGVFRQLRTVGWRDVDETARAGPATLAAFAEDCGVAVAAGFGWPLERCSAAGFLMVLRRHEVEYGPPPALGDELEIATWASDRTRATAVRHYLMEGPAGVVARFRSRYAWLDAGSRRPMRIPNGFLADFATNFAGTGG